VLQDIPQAKVRAYVVWEPVLVTDAQPPSTSVLARASDRRVAQFWDKDRTVSSALRGSIAQSGRTVATTSGTVVWDTVAMYAADAQWADGDPRPTFVGGPVIKAESGLRRALADALPHLVARPQ